MRSPRVISGCGVLARLGALVGVLCAASWCVPSPVHARDREHRLAVAGGVGVQVVQAGGASSDVVVPGGGLRFAYGWSHLVEVGGELHFGLASALELPEATLRGATGLMQTGTLWADFMAVEATADLRLILGVRQSRWFVRTHPVLGLRAGVAARYLHNELLLDARSGGAIPLAEDMDLSLTPFVGATAGVEHRFGRSFVVGLIANGIVDLSGDVAAGLRLEASWHWY